MNGQLAYRPAKVLARSTYTQRSTSLLPLPQGKRWITSPDTYIRRLLLAQIKFLAPYFIAPLHVYIFKNVE